MTESNIVKLHEDPALRSDDIPAQLRSLAARIEAGEYGAVDGLFAIMPRDKRYPKIMGWGINDGAYDPIIQVELAREWLLRAAAGLPILEGFN